MSAIYKIRCNGCCRDFPGSEPSLYGTRLLASQFGWTNPARGADFCDLCSKERAAKAKKENPNGYF